MDRKALEFRFRPRHGGLAMLTIAAGFMVSATTWMLRGPSEWLLLGGLGAVLGVAYLRSPAWRLVVAVSPAAVEVRRGAERKFRLEHRDVVELRYAPATKTCFLSGGTPQTSLLVPGPGAMAPYTFDNKDALYAALVAWTPPDKRREVPQLLA